MKQLNRISYYIDVCIGLHSFGKKVFGGCLRIAPKKDVIFLTESHSDSGGGGFWLKASVTGITGPVFFINYTHAFPLQVREVAVNRIVAD